MRLVLSMWSLEPVVRRGDLSLEGFLDYAVAQRYDGVELLDCFWEDRPRDIERLLSQPEGAIHPCGGSVTGGR